MKKYFVVVTIFLVIAALVSLFSVKRAKEDLACGVPNGGNYDSGAVEGVYEGQKIPVPALAEKEDIPRVLGTSNQERWIEVSLSEQKIRAWEGNQLFLESPISTGLPWWPTPTGEFRIWAKFRYTNMVGGSGKYYYNLPNVPYVMFFENNQIPGWRGYSLHGTYWHHDFGKPHSHGCVNLPTDIAKMLYYWTLPDLPAGKSSTTSNDMSQGTRVVIHN